MFSIVVAAGRGRWGTVVPDDAALKIDGLAKNRAENRRLQATIITRV
jgi:hypothetical protein